MEQSKLVDCRRIRKLSRNGLRGDQRMISSKPSSGQRRPWRTFRIARDSVAIPREINDRQVETLL